MYLGPAMENPLLAFTEKGIYCEKAQVYLDPWKLVEKAIISHGHADHSRWGHKQYITHKRNIPIINHRLGDINATDVSRNEPFMVNGVKFSLHPAGHIPGSSQIRVEHKGEVGVFSGDYKTEADGLSTPFEPVHCHSFITECTFGLWSTNPEGERELVTFTKAYSGLTDEEFRKVDAWIKKNTLEQFGPVRNVTPELVFEIAFEGIAYSGRHKIAVATRFPRILRCRTDKNIEQANTRKDLKNLIP